MLSAAFASATHTDEYPRSSAMRAVSIDIGAPRACRPATLTARVVVITTPFGRLAGSTPDPTDVRIRSGPSGGGDYDATPRAARVWRRSRPSTTGTAGPRSM